MSSPLLPDDPTGADADRRLPVERMVFFTDAAVAIAMTLLILPLMEGIAEGAAAGDTAFEYLTARSDILFSFILSFVIIARFWRAHHRLYGRVERDLPGIFYLNTVWLLAIVFLPVATAMTGAFASAPEQYLVYIGTMLVCTLALTAMAVLYRRHPEAWREGRVVEADQVRSSIVTSTLLLLALAIALLVPGAGYWSLLILLLGPVGGWLTRRRGSGQLTAPATPRG